MIKLIQPKKFKSRDLGSRFAERIAQKSAAFYYDDDLAQLTFLNLSAQENADAMNGILELLTMVLGLLKNGLGISGGRSEIYLLGQVRIFLTCNESMLKGNEIYSALCEAFNSIAENVNLQQFDGESIQLMEQKLEACAVLLTREREQSRIIEEKVRKNKRIHRGMQAPAYMTQNSMNVHTLQMMRQNRQLMSIMGNSPAYLQLLSKQIDHSSRRLRSKYFVQDFYRALTDEQKEKLMEFILEKNLFSRERAFRTERYTGLVMNERGTVRDMDRYDDRLSERYTESRAERYVSERYASDRYAERNMERYASDRNAQSRVERYVSDRYASDRYAERNMERYASDRNAQSRAERYVSERYASDRYAERNMERYASDRNAQSRVERYVSDRYASDRYAERNMERYASDRNTESRVERYVSDRYASDRYARSRTERYVSDRYGESRLEQYASDQYAERNPDQSARQRMGGYGDPFALRRMDQQAGRYLDRYAGRFAASYAEPYEDPTTDRVVELILRQFQEETTEQRIEYLSEPILEKLTDQITDQIVVLLEHNEWEATESFVEKLTGLSLSFLENQKQETRSIERLVEQSVRSLTRQGIQAIMEQGGGGEAERSVTALTNWIRSKSADELLETIREQSIVETRAFLMEQGMDQWMTEGIGKSLQIIMDQLMEKIEQNFYNQLVGQSVELLSEATLEQITEQISIMVTRQVGNMVERDEMVSVESVVRLLTGYHSEQMEGQDLQKLLEQSTWSLTRQTIRSIMEMAGGKEPERNAGALVKWMKEKENETDSQRILMGTQHQFQQRLVQNSVSEETIRLQKREELRYLLEHASTESMREFIDVLKQEAERTKAHVTSFHTQSMQEIMEEEAYQYYEARRSRMEEFRREKEELQKKFEHAISSLVASRRITQIQEMLEEFEKKEKNTSERTERETQLLSRIKEEIHKYSQEESNGIILQDSIRNMNRNTLVAYSDFLISYVNENMANPEEALSYDKNVSAPTKEQDLFELAEKLEQAFYEPDFVSRGFEMLKEIWEEYLKENETEMLWRVSAGFFQTGRQISLQRFIEWISRTQVETQEAFASLFVTEYEEMAQVRSELERLRREFEPELGQSMEQYEYSQAEDMIRRVRDQGRQLMLLDELSRNMIKRILSLAFSENKELLTTMTGERRVFATKEEEESFLEEMVESHTDIVYRQFQPQDVIREQGLFYDILQDVKVLSSSVYGFTEQYLKRFITGDDVLVLPVTSDALYADVQRDLVDYLSESVTEAVSAKFFQRQTQKLEAGNEQGIENVLYESASRMLTELTEKNTYFWTAEYADHVAETLAQWICASKEEVTGATEEAWKQNLLLKYGKTENGSAEESHEYLEGMIGEIVTQVKNIISEEGLNLEEQSDQEYVRRLVLERLVISKPVMETVSHMVLEQWNQGGLEAVRSDVIRRLALRIVTEHQSLMGNLYVDVRNALWQDTSSLTKSDYFDMTTRKEFWEYLNQTSHYHKLQLLTVRNYLSRMTGETETLEFGLSKVLLEKITAQLDEEMEQQAGRAWEALESRLAVSSQSPDSYEYRYRKTEKTEEDFVQQFVYAALEQMIGRVDKETGESLLVEHVTDHILRTSYRKRMEQLVQLRVEKLDETVQKFLLQLTAEQFIGWQEHLSEGDSYVDLLGRVYAHHNEREAFLRVREEVETLIRKTEPTVSPLLLKNRVKDLLARSEEFQMLYAFLEEYSQKKDHAAQGLGSMEKEDSRMTELVGLISDRIFEKFYLQMERGHVMSKVKDYLDRAIVFNGDGREQMIWNVAEIRKNMQGNELMMAFDDYAREELTVFTERLTYEEVFSEKSNLVKVGDMADRITKHLLREHGSQLADFVRVQYASEALRHLAKWQYVGNDVLREEILHKTESYLENDSKARIMLRRTKSVQLLDIVEEYLKHAFGEEWNTEEKQAAGTNEDDSAVLIGKYVADEFTSDAAQIIYQQVLSQKGLHDYVHKIEMIDVEQCIQRVVRTMLHEWQRQSKESLEWGKENVSKEVLSKELISKMTAGESLSGELASAENAPAKSYLEPVYKLMPGSFSELAKFYEGRHGNQLIPWQENMLKRILDKGDDRRSGFGKSASEEVEAPSEYKLYERELTDFVIYKVLQTKAEEKDAALHQAMINTVLSKVEWNDVVEANSFLANSFLSNGKDDVRSMRTEEDADLEALDVKLLPKLIYLDGEINAQDKTVMARLMERTGSIHDVVKSYIQVPALRTGRSIPLIHEQRLINHLQEREQEISYASLEYMEDYFDHSTNTREVRFALPVARQESQVPEQLEEKMSEIHRQIDHISRQMEQVRSEQKNLGQNFVSKNEMETMRRKLVDDMQEDILVAKSRHGIY